MVTAGFVLLSLWCAVLFCTPRFNLVSFSDYMQPHQESEGIMFAFYQAAYMRQSIDCENAVHVVSASTPQPPRHNSSTYEYTHSQLRRYAVRSCMLAGRFAQCASSSYLMTTL